MKLDRAADVIVCINITLISQLLCFQQKMPKESDESHKEEQSKTDKENGKENTVEPSEEMIRKRIRRSTPSPHRLTPQCKERNVY